MIAKIIGRGLQATVRMDSNAREEIVKWKDGYTIVIDTYKNGPKVCFVKQGKSLLKKKYQDDMKTDIRIIFKYTNIVYEIFTGQIGLDKVYAQNRMIVKGDIFQTLKIVRMFYICECYLFPKFIWKKIIVEKPKLTSNTLNIYIAAILGLK
ncbi:hypothetical protein [Vallitalea maricola]|uniref:hypothetical protein n=1 Tax=Vallitalea maricola TaxID=3074433 RepID=UPI0030DA8B15